MSFTFQRSSLKRGLDRNKGGGDDNMRGKCEHIIFKMKIREVCDEISYVDLLKPIGYMMQQQV